METIVWPRLELIPKKPPRFTPVARSTSGGAGAGGKGQFVASDAGHWVTSFEGVVVHQSNGKRKVMLWDAVAGLVEGRLNALLMPVDVTGRRPLPAGVTDAMIDDSAGVLHSDDSEFSDGSLYEQNWIDVTVSADAARGATTIVVTKTACGDLEPGMDFSPFHRLYRIKKVVAQDSTSATLLINFPLREAVPAGTALNFDNPVCLMRLSSDTEMALDLEAGWYGFPVVRLVEWL